MLASTTADARGEAFAAGLDTPFVGLEPPAFVGGAQAGIGALAPGLTLDGLV